MSRRRRRVGWLLTGVAAASLAACGVEPEASPRDVPEDEQTVDINDPALDPSAGGADRVYFIGPGEGRLLRSVQREATSEEDLIEILLRGPNEDEAQAQFDTAIPATTELIGSPSVLAGVLTVNLTSDIDQLDSQTLMQAIAQIVYTATELDSIDAVQIEIDGQHLAAPTPDGNTTTGSVRIFDYPNAVQTSQPAFPAAALTGSA